VSTPFLKKEGKRTSESTDTKGDFVSISSKWVHGGGKETVSDENQGRRNPERFPGVKLEIHQKPMETREKGGRRL